MPHDRIPCDRPTYDFRSGRPRGTAAAAAAAAEAGPVAAATPEAAAAGRAASAESPPAAVAAWRPAAGGRGEGPSPWGPSPGRPPPGPGGAVRRGALRPRLPRERGALAARRERRPQGAPLRRGGAAAEPLRKSPFR